jgi:multidrug efflux pump subunit AcrA (membrane-fusion protein)
MTYAFDFSRVGSSGDAALFLCSVKEISMKHVANLILAGATLAAVLAACGGGSPAGNPESGPFTDMAPVPASMTPVPTLLAHAGMYPATLGGAPTQSTATMAVAVAVAAATATGCNY